MRRISRTFLSATKRLRQRGSALLASLMVIVGLSLLGLAFVAISETESAISINERNHTQTVALAESGARLVVQWFQAPDQMFNLGLMPTNILALKTQRDVGGTYQGYYKADPTTKLCSLPFGPLNNDLFFGVEGSADITIDRTTTEGRTFLDALNTKFLGAEGTDARPAGEITVIKVFAPPMVGASLVPATAPITGTFFVGGTRYGVATILARAEKFDQPASVATRRSIALAECRIVVSQFPMPSPSGPLQSATSLATNGNFNVHWGLVSAQQSLDLKKDYTTVPWFNAYDRIQFNRGYDSSVQWTPSTAYRAGDIVRPTPAAVTANPLVHFHEYTITVAGTSGAGAASEPAWPDTPAGATISANGVTYKERQPTAYPLNTGGVGAATTPWLYFIARGDITVDDPWFQARTAQNDANAPNGNPQPWPFPFASPAASITTSTPTHHFQFQSFDQYPNFKTLLFPVIDYNFWKAAAVSANGQGGVKYLTWVSGDQYTDGVNPQTFRVWASCGGTPGCTTSVPGFYFFETQNNQNPQNGGPGILAPDVSVNGGSTQYMGSFVYLNANFATRGLSGPTGNFNEPGEPYLDIGYRQVDTASATGDFVRDAAGTPLVWGAANRQWDYQDLPWSNSGAIGGGTANGKFDVYVAQRTVHDPSDTANPNSTYTGWFPVPYTPGCLPGDNSCAACSANPCSEPHEPYLNIKYTGATSGIGFGWYDPATAVTTMRQPKKTSDRTRLGTPVTCTAASSVDDCTSNGYDLDGGLVSLAPSTDGVLYVEGQFDSTGNADYYGSVLVGSGVNAKGTPNLWYDESLSRGTRMSGFPRVMVTSVETDR
jgi:hypothetical protein